MADCSSFDDASVNLALLESLKKFCLSSFKEEQRKAITVFLQKKDVFVILPTGYGKSLCYASLPLVYDFLKKRHGSIAVVVSPLIALMKDQVKTFLSKGLTAVRIGDCDDEDSIMKGEYQLVFVSPETILVKQKWRRMLGNDIYQERLVALVIDEAHCVRTWGKDFRLEYSYLSELRSIVPEVNIMALTATASDTLVSHIIHDTGMARPEIVSVSPNKENLCYGVQGISSMHETFTPLIESLKLKRTSFRRTIIFCQQQLHCGQLYQLFCTQMCGDLLDPIGSPPSLLQNRLVDVFCKGTEDLVKDNIVSQITKSDSKLRVLICTAAFGMGIDCAGVERVIHWGPPNDVETYIQQTGRCGRSGQKSQCILLFGKGLKRFVDKQMLLYCQNKTKCRRSVLFKDFHTYTEDNQCACCDVCSLNRCQCVECLAAISSMQLCD